MKNLGLPTAVLLCRRCADRLTTASSRYSPAAFLRCYSNSAVVTGDADQVQKPLNLVSGQRVDATDSSKQFDLFAPATGKVIKRVDCCGQGDVDSAVAVAKEAFKSWSKVSPFERGQILRRASDLIRERSEVLSRTETLDTGKPIWESRADVLGCADAIEYFGGLAPTLVGEHIPVAGGSFAYTIREPLGVVGGIGAWNYPFQMASWKSAPALAAGNTLVFKPSQFTPLTAVMLGEVYRDAGLPDGVFNVIQGEGETGELMSNHKDIAKMSFTGSVQTGSRIMAACAKEIKHVTLELGGKSAVLIFDDADIDTAVKGAMLANFLNQGQVCSNGTRVFVQRGIYAEFLSALLERTKRMVVGDPNREETTVGATISQQQAAIVLNYIEGAKAEGATILYGGERVTPSPELAGGIYLRPCIVTDVNDDMTVVREEVFGSVMAVLPFDCEDEALARANNSIFGLAGGVFTKDIQRAHRMAAGLEAGSLYINQYNVTPVGVPFGGYKKSGLGRENGACTLQHYTQLKSVYVEMNEIDCPY